MKKLTFFIGLFLTATIAQAATLTSLTKQQVTQMFSDQTMSTISLMTIDNKLVTNNSIMLYSGKDGKVMGQMMTKTTTLPQNDTGTWMVKANGAVCYTWSSWNEHKPVCVFVYKTPNSIFFINEANQNFESLVLLENIHAGNQMTTMTPATTTETTTTTTMPADQMNNMPANGSMPNGDTDTGMTTNGTTNGDSSNY